MPQPILPDIVPQPLVARIITYLGAQVGLLAARPNWDTEIKVTLELPTDVAKEPITFSESRRNFAQSARYKMEWRSYFSSARESTELRIFLTRIREIPVLIPMWPDVCELAGDIPQGRALLILRDLPARSGAGWIITDENFTQWEILTINQLDLVHNYLRLPTGGVSRAYPAGSLLYPLLLGRLEEPPKPESITDEASEIDFKVKEDSTFASRLSPSATAVPIVGSHIPEFATTPLWRTIPNHVRPLDWTQLPDVLYEHVGFLRQDQQRVYGHPPGNPVSRGQQLDFYQAERGSIAQMEFFWRDRRATTLRFMIPTFRGDLRMKANTPVPGTGHEKWISCERSFFSNPGREIQPGDPYVALIDKNDAITPYKVGAQDIQPDETRLVATVNVGTFAASTTIVSHLMLCRFAEPTLQWTYTTPYLGSVQIKFQELATEYPNNIVPITPPPLPEPAYLFIFVEAGIRTDRFTSYENTITIPQTTPPNVYAGTYVPAPFSFDTVKVGLKLDQEKLDLKSFKFDGNPLNKLWPFALDGILTLEIVEVVATNPQAVTAVSRFYGDVWSVDSSWKAVIIPFGNLFDRKFPRFLLSVSDNYTEFSPPTQLPASAYLLTGHLHNPAPPYDLHTSQTLTVTSAAARAKIVLGHNGYTIPPIYSDDYYAGGWLETGANATLEKRGIIHSDTASGSDITLTIDRPLLKAVNAQLVNLYPGYDGSIAVCDAKFNNRQNYGGHPYIPNINPGVKALKVQSSSGGKKAQ